jgi:hypothetical protein
MGGGRVRRNWLCWGGAGFRCNGPVAEHNPSRSATDPQPTPVGDRLRAKGGGCPRIEQSQPGVMAALEALVSPLSLVSRFVYRRQISRRQFLRIHAQSSRGIAPPGCVFRASVLGFRRRRVRPVSFRRALVVRNLAPCVNVFERALTLRRPCRHQLGRPHHQGVLLAS